SKIDELVENADRIIVLHQGAIVVDCPATELSRHVDALFAANIRPPRLMDLRYRLKRDYQINSADADGRDSTAALKAVLGPYLPRAAALPAAANRAAETEAFVRVENLSFVYP